MEPDDTDPWYKKYSALEIYWRDLSNPIKLPKKYTDKISGLNYWFFKKYVLHCMDTKDSHKKKLILKAYGEARRIRTKSRNKCLLSQATFQCQFLKSNNCDNRCKNKPLYDGGKKCVHHRKLSASDLITKGAFKESGSLKRSRDFGSTCYIRHTSTLPRSLNAGRGLFASKHILKDELITIFDFDEVLKDNEVRAVAGSHGYAYILNCGKKDYNYAGLKNPIPGRGMGSFINSPLHSSPLHKANCKWKLNKTIKKPVIYAINDIFPHEELFMTYNRAKV